MKCLLCHSPDLIPVPFDLPPGFPPWFRCLRCGSDTADTPYRPEIYAPGMSEHLIELSGGYEVCKSEVQSNCDWFGHHHELGDNRSFLDVGCGDGAALDVAQSLGWSVHGFDVIEPHYMGPHVTVAPLFTRWLFPQRYAAILCREVLEHVPFPNLLLHELHGACEPGGLVQIQTPVPVDEFHPNIYQEWGHLFIASPQQLRTMLDRAMLNVLDARQWTGRQAGQAYLCRARR